MGCKSGHQAHSNYIFLQWKWPLKQLVGAETKLTHPKNPAVFFVLLPLLSLILMTASETSCQVYFVLRRENLQFQLNCIKIQTQTSNLTIVKSHKVDIFLV